MPGAQLQALKLQPMPMPMKCQGSLFVFHGHFGSTAR